MSWHKCLGCSKIIYFNSIHAVKDHIGVCDNPNNSSDKLFLRYKLLYCIRTCNGKKDVEELQRIEQYIEENGPGSYCFCECSRKKNKQHIKENTDCPCKCIECEDCNCWCGDIHAGPAECGCRCDTCQDINDKYRKSG